MDNQRECSCCRCGFKWKFGDNGEHNCADRLSALLKEATHALEMSLKHIQHAPVTYVGDDEESETAREEQYKCREYVYSGEPKRVLERLKGV